jgi:hypothetical protein
MKDYFGNINYTYNLPINNIYNKTYTAYLSLNGNISSPYTTTITTANIYSNVATTGFPSSSDNTIIDNNTLTSTSALSSSFTKNAPPLVGDVYMNTLTANDITIAGTLSVRQYQAKNIINTTTTNYQLIVSEDISLNGRLFTSGNVGIGTGNPSVALDVIGNVRCTKGYELNYSIVPTYTPNQIGYTTSSGLIANTTISNNRLLGMVTLPRAGVWLAVGQLLGSGDTNNAGNITLTLGYSTSGTNTVGSTLVVGTTPTIIAQNNNYYAGVSSIYNSITGIYSGEVTTIFFYIVNGGTGGTAATTTTKVTLLRIA